VPSRRQAPAPCAVSRPGARGPRRLFGLLREGRISAQVAARFRRTDAAAALRFAEQGGKTGKVALIA
jgi:NADPH:quinone reductase-like Zn-dependent oxidoreductase